ncbi:MAG: transposase [Deltaproteobacteria bacterium]|nr:transposase [Deltaproteobacteria bacterium]
MTQNNCNRINPKTKQLTAQDVYQLTSETLQAHLKLDMSNSPFDAQDIWDVVIAAAVERTTIEMACDLLEAAPSPNTVRQAVYSLLAQEKSLLALEALVNTLLVTRLPSKLFSRALVGAADITEIPYHGQHEEEDEHIRRGRAKHGTTHFHCFATLYIVKNNKRYTVAVTLVRRSDKTQQVLQRLLEQGKTLGLRLKRLYLDRGFDNNGVVAYLKQQSFPTIIPLTIRGKQGGTRALLKGRKSYQTTYTRASTRYGEQVLNVHVACKYSKGRYGRQGVCHFAYVIIGKLKMLPHQVFEEYRRRFGIETSYRLMNTVRARTTSSSVSLRLFFVALSFMLLNLWCYVKWCHLFVSRRGPRQILHHLLPLARWRLWLWEMVKQRLGFSLTITIPSHA